MIEDIEGATSEPARRRHAAVLSAASASIALALLVVLVGPLRVAKAPAASPTASTGPVVGGTSRAVPVRVVPDAVTSWFSVSCGTSDVAAPEYGLTH
jgi:hypothetical protein